MKRKNERYQSAPKRRLRLTGTLIVSEVLNIAAAGEAPRFVAYELTSRPYQEKTIGLNRRIYGLNAGIEIQRIVDIDEVRDLSTNDIVTLKDSRQYKITEIQELTEEVPKTQRLSLELLTDAYDWRKVATP